MRIGEVYTGRVAISTPAVGFTGHSMSSMRCGVFKTAPCVPLGPNFAVDNYICHVMPGTALLKLQSRDSILAPCRQQGTIVAVWVMFGVPIAASTCY